MPSLSADLIAIEVVPPDRPGRRPDPGADLPRAQLYAELFGGDVQLT